MVHPVRLAAGLVTAVTGTTAMLGVPGQAAAAPGSATDHRYYQAAVNLLDPDAPGAGGFVGGVSFSARVGGATSVNVFLSRAATVVCPDDGDDFATLTVRTGTDEATAPGPVSLQIDRRLRAAEGVAVVDLVEESSPGCGQEPTVTVLPSQTVRIVAQGTTVRFRTGMESRASTGRDSARLRSVDFSRDGVGSASVGSWVQDASSEAAFLKYAIDRSSVRGDTVELSPNAAPAGGFGAMGAFTRERLVDGAVVFEDVLATATATVGAAPRREEGVDVFALRSTQVACAGEEPAELLEVIEGSGPVTVTIDPRLARATAAGTITATRFTFDGCTACPGRTRRRWTWSCP